VIEVLDWSREVVLGERAWITFRLSDGMGRLPSRPVRTLILDARVDGNPGTTIHGEDVDLREVRGLSILMTKLGAYSLHVIAIDDLGCKDETMRQRNVVVVTR
jgi:hypothetical protein